MINNNLDDIVKIQIAISDPALTEDVFNRLLMVIAPPTGTGTQTIGTTALISSAKELLDFGYTEQSEAYIAANVVFSQDPSPDQVAVAVRQVTSEAGAETVTYESMATVLNRAEGAVSFYGIDITEFAAVSTDLVDTIGWAEANEKLFGFTYTSNPATLPVQNTNYNRTFAVYAGAADGYAADTQPVVNKYTSLALMAKCFCYDPGSETFAFKTLATIVPSLIGTTDKNTLDTNNVTTYLRYAGKNITQGGRVLGGEWIDVIRFRDWLKLDMQTNVFNALRQNKKLPFTDDGITVIENAIEATLKAGVQVGGISRDFYGEDGALTPGYTITVPLASSLSEAQRKSRKLTGVKWTARLAGAIHAVEIEGYLTF